MERLYPHRGGLEVICGSMFSGKTEELIKRLKRAQIARLKVQAFKPIIDSRYSETEICSHNQTTCASIPIAQAEDIFDHLDETTEVVGIDEAQFFDDSLVEIAQKLAHKGIRVVVAGLDTDWQAQPFGPMPALLAVADFVSKQNAVCMVCGGLASRTQRVVASSSKVLVGSGDLYEARCRQHFIPAVDKPTRPVASQEEFLLSL